MLCVHPTDSRQVLQVTNVRLKVILVSDLGSDVDDHEKKLASLYFLA